MVVDVGAMGWVPSLRRVIPMLINPPIVPGLAIRLEKMATKAPPKTAYNVEVHDPEYDTWYPVSSRASNFVSRDGLSMCAMNT